MRSRRRRRCAITCGSRSRGASLRSVRRACSSTARIGCSRAEELFRGTLAQTSVYPREVVKAALARNAAAVIFAHNHPSGVAEPSRADELLTQALKQALALVDIRTLDHFVVAGSRLMSFAERGCSSFSHAPVARRLIRAHRMAWLLQTSCCCLQQRHVVHRRRVCGPSTGFLWRDSLFAESGRT